MRKNRIFFIFLGLVTLTVTAAIFYLQSGHFNKRLKKFVALNIPSDLGIGGDFSELRVKVFPPGISIVRPKLILADENFLGVPAGSKIESELLDLNFYPLQMLSGDIRVSELVVYRGKLNLEISISELKKGKAEKKKSPTVSWDDLFKLQIEAVELNDTDFSIRFIDDDTTVGFSAALLRVEKAGGSVKGYKIDANLNNILATGTKIEGYPTNLERLAFSMFINRNGIEAESLYLQNKSIVLTFRGLVEGDVLEPRSLKLDGDIVGSGLVQDFAHDYAFYKEAKDISGSVQVKGQIKADLVKPLETMLFRGEVEGTEVGFKGWSADRVFSRIEMPGLSVVKIKDTVITGNIRDRVPPTDPGYGGSVKVADAEFDLKKLNRFGVKLELDNAHLHWLGEGAIAGIFHLDTRLSGNLDLDVSLKSATQEFGMRVYANLQTKRFILDNQKYKRIKKRRKLLDVSDVSIVGNATLDDEKLNISGFKIGTGGTNLDVTGLVDFNKGVSLEAKGPIVLSDIKEISEIKIDGSGDVRVLVSGPSDKIKIQFISKLASAEYLGLYFGNLDGEIIWDDHLDELIFNKIKASKGRTDYEANGKIEIDAEKLDIDFFFREGNINDLIQVFSDLTKDVWWFPHTLTGDFSGAVKVSGGLDLDKLKVLGKISGNGWDYLQEKFTTVELEGGYDSGNYVISRFECLKYRGRINGKITYFNNNDLEWDLSTSNLSLTDLDHVARLDVPLKGGIDIQSEGKGSGANLNSHTNIVLSGLRVRGESYESSSLDVDIKNNRLRLSGNGNGKQGSINLDYALKTKQASTFRLGLQQFDFTPFVILLNPKLMVDSNLLGYATGAIDISFRSGELERGSGFLELKDFVLNKSNFQGTLLTPTKILIEKGSHPPTSIIFGSNAEKATLFLRMKDSDISWRTNGSIDMRVLEFLFSEIQSSSGRLELAARARGPFRTPELLGGATISDGRIRAESLDNPFENIRGRLNFEKSILKVSRLDATLGGGAFDLGGKFEFFSDRFPKINLRAHLKNNRIRVYPFDFVKVNGFVDVVGDGFPYLISGKITSDNGLITQSFMSGGSGKELQVARFAPPPTIRTGVSSRFNLDMKLTSDGGILVKNDLFDLEAKADMALVNTIDAPVPVGTAEVKKGNFLFKDQVFRISSSTIEFDNPTLIDPKFDLTASNSIRNIDIRLYATGRKSKFNVELSSNPVMPETELLSLLALGLTSEDMEKLRSSDQELLQQGGAASLLLHSLEFNKEVKNKTGLEIGLDESVNTQRKSSIFRPAAQGVEGSTQAEAAPKVVLKRRIGKKLDLSVGSTVGAGTTIEREVNAELHVTPAMSVIGVWNTFEGQDTKDNQTSYGVDVKLQKRFK